MFRVALCGGRTGVGSGDEADLGQRFGANEVAQVLPIEEMAILQALFKASRTFTERDC